MNKVFYEEIAAFHPGYYIKELLEEEEMSQEDLAKRLQTSGKNVSDLLHGKINLTDEMALRLATVFQTSVSLWLNLNQSYIEKKLEIERRKQEAAECALAQNLDYDFWLSQGLVPKTGNPLEQVRALREYLKVSSLEVLRRRDFLVQYRREQKTVQDINVIAANAWVQTAINLGMQMETDVFRAKELISKLNPIRKMIKEDFAVSYPEVQKILGMCGVALVFLPNLKHCNVIGAVKWLNKGKAVLAINSDLNYEDEFWFSLFHELGHVLQQRLKILNVSGEEACCETDELLQRLEEEANRFARDMLVPDDAYDAFLKRVTIYTEKEIGEFAIEIDTTPQIVRYRMQIERMATYQTMLNGLKEKA